MNSGDYLVYERVNNAPIVQLQRITIDAMADASLRYTVMLTTYHERKPNERDEQINDDYVTDASGVILRFHDKSKQFGSLGRQQVKGRLVKVWLPTASRKDGGSVALSGFPAPLHVGAQRAWEKWQVWPVSYSGHKYFYDVKTGLLVGREWEGQKWVLQDSSIRGL